MSRLSLHVAPLAALAVAAACRLAPPTGEVPLDSAAPGDAAGNLDGAAESPRLVSETITLEHRFVPGKMFGGWGPHLGHLVRAGRPDGGSTDLYWVDDLCAQETPGDCDVLQNRRVGIFHREPSGWRKVAVLALPAGVQQNTATLAQGEALRSYGIDSAGARIIECVYVIKTGVSGCAPLPIPTGPAANYIGAALSPVGARVVYWTNVVDGGGGTFSYIVDYGGGWNGPRTGGIGGYNDCGYAHAAFQVGGPRWTLFGQVVSGRAPNWQFSTLVGEASLATTDAVSWTNALAPAGADPVASTDDLLIDDVTGDTHLLARTAGGAAAYYFRPRDGAWSGALFTEPASYRARLLASPEELLLVHGPNAGGLRVRAVVRAALRPGRAVDWAETTPRDLPLPAGFGAVIAIYPVSAVYQSTRVSALELVVVGSTRENEAVFVGRAP